MTFKVIKNTILIKMADLNLYRLRLTNNTLATTSTKMLWATREPSKYTDPSHDIDVTSAVITKIKRLPGIVATVTSNTTLSTHGKVNVDTTVDEITIVVPAITSKSKYKVYSISNTGTHVAHINRSGADTIDGGATLLLVAGADITIINDGTEWSSSTTKISNAEFLPYFDIDAICGLNASSGDMLYLTGSAAAVTPTTAFGREILNLADAAAARTKFVCAPAAGSSSIITVGTITTGVWNGTTIAVANGGTGGAPSAANQVFVSTGTTAGTWTTLPTSVTGDTLVGTGASQTLTNKTIGPSNDVTAAKIKTGSSTEVTITAAVPTADQVIIASSGTAAAWGTITKVGTIVTGTWNGNIIPVLYGGTGANDAALALSNLGASPVGGSSSITTVGTIISGTWRGTPIEVGRGGIGNVSAPTGGGQILITSSTNPYEPAWLASPIAAGKILISTTATTVGWLAPSGTGPFEKILLATDVTTAAWVDTTSITKLGTIGTGTWNANAIAVGKGGTGASNSPPATGSAVIISSNATTSSWVAATAQNQVLMAGANPYALTWKLIDAVGTIASGTWNGNAIGVAYGGTGKSSVTAGKILYTTTLNTFDETAVVASGRSILGLNITVGQIPYCDATTETYTPLTVSAAGKKLIQLANIVASRILYTTGDNTFGVAPITAAAINLLSFGGSANTMLYSNGADTYSSTALKESAINMIGQEIGFNEIFYGHPTVTKTFLKTTLTASGRSLIAATIAADQMLYGNGAGTFTTTTLNTMGRSIIGGTAANARSQISLGNIVCTDANTTTFCTTSSATPTITLIGSASSNQSILFNDGADSGSIVYTHGVSNSDILTIKVSDADRVKITSTGGSGITGGATSSGVNLVLICGGTSAASGIIFNNRTSNTASITYNETSKDMVINTQGFDRIKMTTTVGVGATNIFALVTSNLANIQEIQFIAGAITGAVEGSIKYNHSNDTMAFITNTSTTPLTLSSSAVNVGASTLTNTTPNASAVIDFASTTKGVLIPRMTTTEKNAITPLDSLLVYDSTLGRFSYYQGSIWRSLSTNCVYVVIPGTASTGTEYSTPVGGSTSLGGVSLVFRPGLSGAVRLSIVGGTIDNSTASSVNYIGFSENNGAEEYAAWTHGIIGRYPDGSKYTINASGIITGLSGSQVTLYPKFGCSAGTVKIFSGPTGSLSAVDYGPCIAMAEIL